MTDISYCMSSFLALRYIEKDDKEFKDGLHHKKTVLPAENSRIKVNTAEDIDKAIGCQIAQFRKLRKGIMLSGGMDSAIVASYLSGSDAYTFRFLDGTFQSEELMRAEYYADRYGLRLHYVDISWETVNKFLGIVMQRKGAPVHSIEPQIYQAAMQAKEDGVKMMLIGNSSDPVFGGMDGLLSKDWTLEGFMQRYIFVQPEEVLKKPVSMQYLFERYRTANEKIDFLRFMDEVYSVESSGSYDNAFDAADMPYFDPYAGLIMGIPLDLSRIRRGESKYLIRELFRMKYPDVKVPEKNPMPRPVDIYFENWQGPKRPEFRNNIDMSRYNGNQKWLMWCLEQFLNQNDITACDENMECMV